MPVPAQVITAALTLFTADERLDPDATAAHLAAARDAGADGVFAAGTTGEFIALSDEERLRVLDIAVEVLGPERTYAHVGAATSRQAERLAARMSDCGARRLAAVTPYFLPAPTDALLRYYERLVAVADGAEVFAYLFPARTTTPSTPALLPKLADVGVRGVKISGESDDSVAAYLAAAPEGFMVFSGNDTSFGWLVQRGGAGIVSGVSSVFPQPFLAQRDALRAGDVAAATALQPRVEQAVAAVRAGSIAHMKAALELQGHPAGPPRVSGEPVTAADREELAWAVAELG